MYTLTNVHFPAPKWTVLNLVKATNTNLSQVFSIFKDPDDTIYNLLLDTSTEFPPDFEFEDEQGIVRKIWAVMRY